MVLGQREPTATRVHNKGMDGGWTETILWFEFKFIPKLTNVVNSQVHVFLYLLTNNSLALNYILTINTCIY